jgi:hypothetical protein
MITNIYQEFSTGNNCMDTIILCNACYEKWHPAGGVRKLAQAHRNTPCEMCQPDKFGQHLENMRGELNNE